MYDIVVIGAGVVGLSTAVNIQSLLPDRNVVIIADKFTSETTSDGAAGVFAPTDISVVKSLPQYKKWLHDSYQWYHELYHTDDPSVTGVQRVSGYAFTPTKQEPEVFHDVCYNYRDLTEKELHGFPGNKKFGWMYTTLMVECNRYLPWLTKRFLENGGQIVKETLTDISKFVGNCSVLVNCSALGARQLFNDKDVYPVRGHVIRIKAPWIKHLMVDSETNTYFYPGQDNVVVGGTLQKDEYDTSIERSEHWFDDILQRAERLIPGVRHAEIVTKWVGLRPYKSKITVDRDILNINGKKLQVVHNYGHGANGVALSWGTSLEAAQLVCDIIASQKKTKSKL